MKQMWKSVNKYITFITNFHKSTIFLLYIYLSININKINEIKFKNKFGL